MKKKAMEMKKYLSDLKSSKNVSSQQSSKVVSKKRKRDEANLEDDVGQVNKSKRLHRGSDNDNEGGVIILRKS